MMAIATSCPSSCLLQLRRPSEPRIPHLGSFSTVYGLRRFQNSRYFPTFLHRKNRECRAIDEEGFYVQEDHGYIHPRYPFSHQFNPVDERNLIRKIADELQKVTPIRAVKLATIGAIFWTISYWFLQSVLFNPYFYTYGSWILVFWPWPAALIAGTCTLYIGHKLRTTLSDYRTGLPGYWATAARERNRLLLVAGCLLWLLLVPLGHFHGYIEGYPLLFFTVYFAYFAFDTYIRMRIYGQVETLPPEDDWVVPVDTATRVGFLGSVIAGHWLAAFEAPPLVLSWNLAWQSQVGLAMVALALAMKYFATYFMLKFSRRVDTPNIAVPFGPYRWVRHPVYGSSMLLFCGFCMALRAYGSLSLLLTGCLFYYEQLVKKEEELLVKHFGDEYVAYKKSVRRKYVPYVY